MEWTGNGFATRLQSVTQGGNDMNLLGLGLASAGVSALTDVINSGFSIKAAKEQNRLNQEVFDYNKELNALQMQREDTALQRRMADAKAAGLNPLSVLGSEASSGAGGMLTAPDVASPTIQNGALDQLSSILKTKEAQNQQKQLNAALRQADDEHNMAILNQNMGEEQVKALQLQNQKQTAENAVLVENLNVQLEQAKLRNRELEETIEHLRSQTQTEETKQDLNRAEAELATARTAQQRLETQVYSMYEPRERAYKLQTLAQEYAELLQIMNQREGTYVQNQRKAQLENDLKAIELSIAEHDLPIYLDSSNTSSHEDRTSTALSKFLSGFGMTVSKAVIPTIVKLLFK